MGGKTNGKSRIGKEQLRQHHPPGDQNGGREVSREKYYVHSKGWYVIRAKDPVARERIAVAMERACDNDNIGYSQPTRNTLYNDVKPFGFDPARTTKKVNTDCSALVRVCVHFAGIPVGDFSRLRIFENP